MDPFNLEQVFRRIDECLTKFHQSHTWNAVKVPAQEMVVIHKVVGKKDKQEEKEPLVKAEVKLEQIDFSSGLSNIVNSEDVMDENPCKVHDVQKDVAFPDGQKENIIGGSVKGRKGAIRVGKTGVGVRQKKQRVKVERIGIDPNCLLSRDSLSNSDHNSNSDNENCLTPDENLASEDKCN